MLCATLLPGYGKSLKLLYLCIG